jgi:hypothetical protein
VSSLANGGVAGVLGVLGEEKRAGLGKQQAMERSTSLVTSKNLIPRHALSRNEQIVVERCCWLGKIDEQWIGGKIF